MQNHRSVVLNTMQPDQIIWVSYPCRFADTGMHAVLHEEYNIQEL